MRLFDKKKKIESKESNMPKKNGKKVVTKKPAKAVKGSNKDSKKVVTKKPAKAVKGSNKDSKKVVTKKPAKAVKGSNKDSKKAVTKKPASKKTLSPTEILKNSPIDTERVIVTRIDPFLIKKAEPARPSIFDGPSKLLFKKESIIIKKSLDKKKVRKVKSLNKDQIKNFKKILLANINETKIAILNKEKEIQKISEILRDPGTMKDNLENGITNDNIFQEPSAQLLKLRDKLYSQEDALLSIKNKTYGICAKCNLNIEKKRLDAKPESLYHVECKPRVESNYPQIDPIEILTGPELIEDSDEEDLEIENDNKEKED
jgi:RNA polymerase-binding transcription factor DksA